MTTFLGYFKQSCKGSMYLMWGSANMLVPSDNARIITIHPESAEYKGYTEVFQVRPDITSTADTEVAEQRDLILTVGLDCLTAWLSSPSVGA
eukprot:2086084-Rhodomonas_salina.6